MSENLYLSGNFAPIADERSATGLRVHGRIPEALDGRLLRIGPNPIAPDPANYHWFLGNGMVHGLRLRDGEALWYHNRFVRDDELVAARGWPPVEGPERKLFAHGVANTNVIAHAGRFYAIVEGGNPPVELDGDLETLRRSDFEGTLPRGFSAHPQLDPDTGELFAAVYSQNHHEIQMVVVAADGRVRRHVEVPVPGSPMVHGCAITENYFVLLDLPVVADQEADAQGELLPYRFTPSYGARVGLLPREGNAEDVVWSEVEPCYAFHPANAYEDSDGRVVIDIVRHPSVFAAPNSDAPLGPPTLERWVVDPSGGALKEQRLDERPQEFPRIDERLVGKAHRYAYSVEFGENLRHEALLKHDLQRGTCERHHEGEDRQFLEPVFVPHSGSAGEDEGWLLSYVYDASRDSSDVVILEAQDFGAEPIARIELPGRVPFGFHGNWVPEAR